MAHKQQNIDGLREDIQAFREENKRDFYSMRDVLGSLMGLISGEKGFEDFQQEWYGQSTKMPCEDNEDCRNAVREVLGQYDFRNMLHQLQESTRDQEKHTSWQLSNCRAKFTEARLDQPDHQLISRAMEQAKQKISENVLGLYSTESGNIFRRFMDEELSFAREERHDPQQSEIDFIKMNHSSKKNNPLMPYESFPTNDLIYRLFAYNKNGEANPFKGSNVCYMADTHSTSSYDGGFSHGNIFIKLVNPFTSGLPDDYGDFLVAHEIGHALSEFFLQGRMSSQSFDQYKLLRGCANRNHVGQSLSIMDNVYHSGDLFHTEEDTADLIGFLATQDSDTLELCPAIQPTPDGLSYTDTGLGFHHDSKRNRPPLMLRLIRQAVHNKKTKLPESCREFANLNQWGIEVCF